MVFDIETGRRSQVTRGGVSSFAVWASGGKSLVYASQQGSSAHFNLYRREAAGVETPELLLADGNWEEFPSSIHGDKLLYDRFGGAGGFDIYTLDLDDPAATAAPLISTAEDTGNGQFSPDGRWVAYEVWEEGLPEVWVEPYPPDGRRRKISGEDGGFAPIWSHADREIFYVEDGRRMMSVRYAITAAGAFAADAPSSCSSERSTSTARPNESSTSPPTGSVSSSSTRPTPRATRSWWSRTGLRSSSAWFRRSEGQRHRAQRPRRTPMRLAPTAHGVPPSCSSWPPRRWPSPRCGSKRRRVPRPAPRWRSR